MHLFRSSRQSAEDASRAQWRKSRRHHEDDLERRAGRALSLVQMGELSAGRQALEGAPVAPGNRETLNQLQDPVRRPPVMRDPLPAAITEFVSDRSLSLEEKKFASNLRSSRKVAAAGPSGMTADHLRPLLDNEQDSHRLFRMGEKLCQALTPPSINATIRMGRLTALQKPRGSVRGIVVGDIVRRLVSRTMAQQLSKVVERCTAPYQYAMSTKAGTECIAHALQMLTELDPQATVVSIDGVGAYDTISRKAMLEALARMPGEALAFVRLLCGQPSQFLWEDAESTVHTVAQGEEGEQGDPLMPLLFSSGQHAALEAAHSRMRTGETRFAFLDDVYFVVHPDRVGDMYQVVEQELYRHSRIRIHTGKTQVWNSAGVRPEACDTLERTVRASDPDARVWKGPGLLTSEQGVRVLGTPSGAHRFCVGSPDGKIGRA